MAQLIQVAVILAVFISIVAIAVLLLKRGKSGGSLDDDESTKPGQPDVAHLCRAKGELLTPGEKAFYGVLRGVVGDKSLLFAKVRAGDLVSVPGTGSEQTTARNKTQMRHADFVLCEPGTTKPILVIELDDKTHNQADRKDRDGFMDRAYAAAGIPVLHVPAASSYSRDRLEQDIRAKLGRPTSAPALTQ